MEDIKKISDLGHSDYDLYFIQPLLNFGKLKDGTFQHCEKYGYGFSWLDKKEGPPTPGIAVANSYDQEVTGFKKRR